VLLLAAPAAPQNLLVNGEFDANLSGWSNPLPTTIGMAWSPQDPSDPTPSGSIEMVSTVSNAGTLGPSQCVDVDAGVPLRMGVTILVPTQSFEYLDGDPFVRYFDTVGCGGYELSVEYPIGRVSMGEGWKRIEDLVVPPAATRSLRALLGVSKPATALPATVYFDAVFLLEPDRAAQAAGVFVVLGLLAARSGARAQSSASPRMSPHSGPNLS
jgi:hypothetical protein